MASRPHTNKHINIQHDDIPIEMSSDAFNHNNSQLQIPTLFISLLFSLLYYFQRLQSLSGGVYTQQIHIQMSLQNVLNALLSLLQSVSNSLAPAHKLCCFPIMIFAMNMFSIMEFIAMDSRSASICPSSSIFITNHERRWCIIEKSFAIWNIWFWTQPMIAENVSNILETQRWCCHHRIVWRPLEMRTLMLENPDVATRDGDCGLWKSFLISTCEFTVNLHFNPWRLRSSFFRKHREKKRNHRICHCDALLKVCRSKLPRCHATSKDWNVVQNKWEVVWSCQAIPPWKWRLCLKYRTWWKNELFFQRENNLCVFYTL